MIFFIFFCLDNIVNSNGVSLCSTPFYDNVATTEKFSLKTINDDWLFGQLKVTYLKIKIH